MKKIFSVLLTLFFVHLVFGQKIDTSISHSQQGLHDLYIQKAKTNRTVGWLLLSAGSFMIIVGTGQAFAHQEVNYDPNRGKALFLTGFATGLLSIPFFVSSHHNKKKAVAGIKNENVMIGNRVFPNSDYSVLVVRISL